MHRSLQELLSIAEEVLELAENKRESTIVRVDAGGGEAEDINWLLHRHYWVLAKAKSWRRAHKLAASVTEWHLDPKVPEREVGWVTAPYAYVTATRQLAVRHRKKNGKWSYHVLVFNLTDVMLYDLADQPMPQAPNAMDVLLTALHAYDRRGGGVETQNKGDKQGLGLSQRNKHAFAAQEMLVVLGQLAHDVVIWTRNDLANADPRLQKYGVQRTVRDALHIDGQVTIGPNGQVEQVILNSRHPLATAFHNACSRSNVATFAQKLGHYKPCRVGYPKPVHCEHSPIGTACRRTGRLNENSKGIAGLPVWIIHYCLDYRRDIGSLPNRIL